MNRIVAGLLITVSLCALSSAGTVTVVVLPVAVDDKAAERVSPTQTQSIESLLDIAASEEEGITVLSRGEITTLLDEEKAARTQNDPAREFQKFRPTAVLLSSRVFRGKKEALHLILRLIAPQSGLELSRRGCLLRAEEQWEKSISKAVRELMVDLPAAQKSSRMVRQIKLDMQADGVLNYSAWRWALLRSQVGDAIESIPGAVVLKPVLPNVALEERLYRAMGLLDVSSEKKTDGLSRLWIRGNGTLVVSLRETPPSAGQSVADVKVTATVSIPHADLEPKVVVGTVGQWDAFVGKLRTTAIAMLKQSGDIKSLEVDAKQASRQASQLVQYVVSLTSESKEPLEAWRLNSIQPRLQRDAARAAIQAWHLDPTNVQAGYFAAMLAHYDYPGAKPSVEHYQRAAELCVRYLDQFGQSKDERYYDVCKRRFSNGWRVIGRYKYRRTNKDKTFDHTKQTDLEPYAMHCIFGMADVAQWEQKHPKKARSNSVDVVYRWLTKMLPYIRKPNRPAVRAYVNQRVTVRKPTPVPNKAFFDEFAKVFQRIHPRFSDMQVLANRIHPARVESWTWPESLTRSVRARTRGSSLIHAQPLAFLDENTFLVVTPAAQQHDQRELFSVRVPTVGRPISPSDISPIPWPKHPSPPKDQSGRMHMFDILVERTGNDVVVWIATGRYGLAKLVRTGKTGWSGRWYTSADGLPEGVGISAIRRVKNRSKDGLLLVLVDLDGHRDPPTNTLFLETATGNITSLGHKTYPTQLVFPNGKSTWLRQYAYPRPLYRYREFYALEGCDLSDAKWIVPPRCTRHNFHSIHPWPGAKDRVASTHEYKSIGRYSTSTQRFEKYYSGNGALWKSNGEVAGMSISNATTGTPLWKGHVIDMRTCSKDFFLAINPVHHDYNRPADWLMLWKPGAKSPREGDEWSGPFVLPESHRRVVAILPDKKGGLWLTTHPSGLVYVNPDDLQADARKHKMVSSSSQLRDELPDAFAAPHQWIIRTHVLMAQRKYDQAAAALEPHVKVSADANMLAGHVAMLQKKYSLAVERFAQAAKLTKEDVLRRLAWWNQGMAYSKSGKTQQATALWSQANLPAAAPRQTRRPDPWGVTLYHRHIEPALKR